MHVLCAAAFVLKHLRAACVVYGFELANQPQRIQFLNSRTSNTVSTVNEQLLLVLSLLLIHQASLELLCLLFQVAVVFAQGYLESPSLLAKLDEIVQLRRREHP